MKINLASNTNPSSKRVTHVVLTQNEFKELNDKIAALLTLRENLATFQPDTFIPCYKSDSDIIINMLDSVNVDYVEQ